MKKQLKRKIFLALQLGEWETARTLSRELDRLEAAGDQALDGQYDLFEGEQSGPVQAGLFDREG